MLNNIQVTCRSRGKITEGFSVQCRIIRGHQFIGFLSRKQKENYQNFAVKNIAKHD